MGTAFGPDRTAIRRTKIAGVLAGVFALIGGFIILYLFDWLGLSDKLGDSAFIAMLALPLIAFALAVYSDRVTELTAGGIAVKFAQFANAEVDVRQTSVSAEADVETINIIEKSSLHALEQRRSRLLPGDKVAVTLQLGRHGYYSDRGVHHYLNVLLAQDAEMPVVFVDEDGRFAASTLGVKLRDALSDDSYGERQQQFIEAIETSKPGNVDKLASIVAITEASLEPGTTNAQALEIMIAEDASVLISVDGAGKPTGVVRRDAIMAKMLAALTMEDALA